MWTRWGHGCGCLWNGVSACSGIHGSFAFTTTTHFNSRTFGGAIGQSCSELPPNMKTNTTDIQTVSSGITHNKTRRKWKESCCWLTNCCHLHWLQDKSFFLQSVLSASHSPFLHIYFAFFHTCSFGQLLMRVHLHHANAVRVVSKIKQCMTVWATQLIFCTSTVASTSSVNQPSAPVTTVG